MSALVYQGCRLTIGILYPAYCSFKAVRSKNVKEYVKWMMYWIVFALFSFAEVFADFVLVWFPFYYEIKIFFIMWLVAPATKGSSVLYRKVVHPQLLKREKEIDANISKATDQGYAALITLGSRGFNFATSVVLSTAIKGSSKLSDQLQKSLSLNDLSGDAVDYRPRRLLQSNLSLDDDEQDNRLIGERYRLETVPMEQSLEDIDREVDRVPVLESATDVQRRRRRRKIESTIHEVMSDSSGPTLRQPLGGSVRLPRKYKPATKETSAAVSEDLGLGESSRSTPVASSPEPGYSSSSSAGNAPVSIDHYFRSPDPATPSPAPSGHHDNAPSGSSYAPSSSPEPSTSSEPSSSIDSTAPSSSEPLPDASASGLTAASFSRRLRLSFFSSSK